MRPRAPEGKLRRVVRLHVSAVLSALPATRSHVEARQYRLGADSRATVMGPPHTRSQREIATAIDICRWEPAIASKLCYCPLDSRGLGARRLPVLQRSTTNKERYGKEQEHIREAPQRNGEDAKGPGQARTAIRSPSGSRRSRTDGRPFDGAGGRIDRHSSPLLPRTSSSLTSSLVERVALGLAGAERKPFPSGRLLAFGFCLPRGRGRYRSRYRSLCSAL